MCPAAPLSQPQAIDNHADDTDADLVQGTRQSLEEKENNRNFHDSSNISQVLSRNDHGPSNMSGINPLIIHDSSAQHLNETYDFSRGDYLEDNDLIDSESSSSCSENSSITSRYSEEYFNPGALLHELEIPSTLDTNPEYFDSVALLHNLETPTVTDTNPEYFDSVALLRNLETPTVTDTNPEYFDSGAPGGHLETPAITDTNPEYFDSQALLRNLETPAATDTNPEYFDSGALLSNLETPAITDTNLRKVDFMLTLAGSQGSQQVLIQPRASGSIGSCSNDMHRDVEETADSSTMMSMQRKQAAHEVSQGPSTSQDSKVRGKRKAVSKIAKFKKKYFCFIPFKF